MKDKIHRAMALIDSTKGKVFGATFIKKDGSIRSGSFRTEFTWERKTDNPKFTRQYAREVHAIIKVVDMNIAKKDGKENAIRGIPLDRLISLTIDGITYDL